MVRMSEVSRSERRPNHSVFDLAMAPVQCSPGVLLDAVRRNVERTVEGLGQLTGIGFRCGCQLTMAGGDDGKNPWRVMAWDDTHCSWSAHRALKAKWETSNL
jgi:hypothetical protein